MKLISLILIVTTLISCNIEKHSYDETGNLCASGKGEFALFTFEQFAKMDVVNKDDLDSIAKATRNFINIPAPTQDNNRT